MLSVAERLLRIAKAQIESTLDKLEARQEKREAGKKQSGFKKEEKPFERKAGTCSKYPSKMLDAFKALEVPVGSDYEICKKAYRKMAALYHPDKWQNYSEEKKATAEEIFKRIGEAYEIIKDFYGIE